MTHSTIHYVHRNLLTLLALLIQSHAICSVPPEVDITTVAVVVNETNPATLTCVATGIPEPNIMWSVAPSVPIVDGFKYTISTDRNVQDSQNIAVTSSLTISDTSVGDSGTYSCEAENAAGAAVGTTELTVQGTCMALHTQKNWLEAIATYIHTLVA